MDNQSSPRERWAAQQRETIVEMIGEDLTEEFLTVAGDSPTATKEDVAMLMAICYARGVSG